MLKHINRRKATPWLWISVVTGILTLTLILIIASHNPSVSKPLSLSKNEEPQALFYPPVLRGFIVNPQSQTDYFDFILDVGSEEYTSEDELKPQAKELINYFFLGLTLPSEELWVNLNPNQPDNLTSKGLSNTDMGQALLEVDLQLKQDAAKLTDPRTPLGKQYWSSLKQKLGKQGVTSLSSLPFSRLWIVPHDAVMEEEGSNQVNIINAKLKICLESEYLEQNQSNFKLISSEDPQDKLLEETVASTMKELILPEIEYAVNHAKRYAPIRQVYYSLILAEYFKQKYQDSSHQYQPYFNSGHLQGLESKTPWSQDKYFQAYVSSYTQGEYSFFQREYDTSQLNTVNKHYFSGGISGSPIAQTDFINDRKELTEGYDTDKRTGASPFLVSAAGVFDQWHARPKTTAELGITDIELIPPAQGIELSTQAAGSPVRNKYTIGEISWKKDPNYPLTDKQKEVMNTTAADLRGWQNFFDAKIVELGDKIFKDTFEFKVYSACPGMQSVLSWNFTTRGNKKDRQVIADVIIREDFSGREIGTSTFTITVGSAAGSPVKFRDKYVFDFPVNITTAEIEKQLSEDVERIINTLRPIKLKANVTGTIEFSEDWLMEIVARSWIFQTEPLKSEPGLRPIHTLIGQLYDIIKEHKRSNIFSKMYRRIRRRWNNRWIAENTVSYSDHTTTLESLLQLHNLTLLKITSKSITLSYKGPGSQMKTAILKHRKFYTYRLDLSEKDVPISRLEHALESVGQDIENQLNYRGRLREGTPWPIYVSYGNRVTYIAFFTGSEFVEGSIFINFGKTAYEVCTFGFQIEPPTTSLVTAYPLAEKVVDDVVKVVKQGMNKESSDKSIGYVLKTDEGDPHKIMLWVDRIILRNIRLTDPYTLDTPNAKEQLTNFLNLNRFLIETLPSSHPDVGRYRIRAAGSPIRQSARSGQPIEPAVGGVDLRKIKFKLVFYE